MPRVRARDYDLKVNSILDAAAALFAKTGYPNARLEEIAKACGATKSMLYHYFPTKDDLLFAMLKEHLDNVVAGIEEALESTTGPKARLHAFVKSYTLKSAQSRRRHVIAMNDSKFLPRHLQAPLLEREIAVTNMVADLLRELNPGLPDDVYKPYTMLLIGMLNWTDIWFRPSGKLKADELCERAARLFLKGFLAEKAEKAIA